MISPLYKMSVAKRFFRYLLAVLVVSRCIVSFVLGYFYLIYTGTEQSTKGWTFVEGIFSQISYLPYLKTDSQSLFYQKFLFRNCLNPYETDENGSLKQDLCKVYTEDNKTYILKLIDEIQRSDGMPVNIEDVFWTYDEIIRQNKRNIASLNGRNQIQVSLEDGKVKVVFPSASEDNQLFFTNAILPKHSLLNANLDEYRINFAGNVVSDACWKLVNQTKDIQSLVFDLGECRDTNFAYYQLKSYRDFEEMDTNLQGGKKSIIDVYEWLYSLEWFEPKRVLTPYLLGIFFNTNSSKMTVRVRRSLAGLINAKFYTWDYQQYIQPYGGDFLNQFYSNGENIKDLISRVNLTEDETAINEQDLKESWAKELPNSITINWIDRKFVFFMQRPTESRMLEVNFNAPFETVKIIAPNWKVFTPTWYKATDKKVSYKLINNENLSLWSNQYTIKGTVKGKEYTIASIDIYVFEHLDNSQNADKDWKFNVLYYHDASTVFVVQQLKTIFSNADILDYFTFEGVFNAEELEWKLLMWSYDLYISTIDLGSRKNVLWLFSTDDASLNPSQYKNPILNSLIKQYANNATPDIIKQINNIFSQDMPAILLGHTYTLLQMQQKLADDLFSGDDSLYANQRRNQVYKHFSLVNNVRINMDEALNLDRFVQFIIQQLMDQKKNKNLIKTGEMDMWSDSEWVNEGGEIEVSEGDEGEVAGEVSENM